MTDAANIAGVAHLIGNPTRAGMLSALKDGGALSAAELACIAGVAPNTASGHLGMLVHGGLLTLRSRGRHRYYELAGAGVADALEAMEALGAATAPRGRARPPVHESVRFARTCYDHLAGSLGVELTWSLVRLGCLRAGRRGFVVTRRGREFFENLGLDMTTLADGSRPLTRSCADWTEHRPHLGGALGAALYRRYRELGWMRSRKGSRAVSVTPPGRTGLAGRFGVEADPRNA